MRRFPIVAVAIVMFGLATSGFAQSSTSPSSSDASVQTKQDKKAEKSKAKAAKAISKAQSGSKGKKAASTQDVAYALAYKKGLPKYRNLPCLAFFKHGQINLAGPSVADMKHSS